MNVCFIFVLSLKCRQCRADTVCLLVGQGRSERDTQTGSPFRYGGRTNGQDVKSFALHVLRFQDGVVAFSYYHGNDVTRRRAGFATLLYRLPYVERMFGEPVAALAPRAQTGQYELRPGGIEGRQGRGEDQCTHAVDQILPYRLAAYHVCPY